MAPKERRCANEDAGERPIHEESDDGVDDQPFVEGIDDARLDEWLEGESKYQ
jgi:hypothetical protein